MMDIIDSSAKELYWAARRRAQREDLLARLKREPDDLIPYETLASILQAHDHALQPALRSIPLDHIVGSVGRYKDFTRSFMPRSGISADRWTQVEHGFNSLIGVPPIEVYQIGDVYFVADGNHRVSVARTNCFDQIEAYVTPIEVGVDVALEPGDTLDQAIIKAERAHFLQETGLARGDDDLEIEFTKPGGFSRLLDHVEVHRYFMQLDHPDAGRPTFQEAARDWYDLVYRPILTAIKRQGLSERFPDTTPADLYVWVSARILQLHALYGQDVSPDEAASQVARETPEPSTPLYQAVLAMLNRLASKAVEAVASEVGAGALPAGLIADTLLAPGPVLAPATVLPAKAEGDQQT